MPQPVAQEPFDSLVRSALDFAEQAARQIKSAPKYAVIHLATAIELTLKARLVKEHWALAVSRPEKAVLASFRSGAFQSVGLDEAIERLRNIAGEPISRDEETCFRQLRDHRNRFVHFYHDDYLKEPDDARLSAIAAEQCRAWYHLRRLLQESWAPLFDSYEKDIARIQKLIAKNREHLEGKYQSMRLSIEADIARGISYDVCKACGNRSSLAVPGPDPIVRSACGVCGHRQDFVPVDCPTCGTAIRVEDLGEAECPKCGFRTTLPWLVELYGPYEDPKEDPETAYCSYCENYEARSVVPRGDTLVCLSCLEEHSSFGQCGWCSEFVAGDLEDSYLVGCPFCDGKLGSDRE